MLTQLCRFLMRSQPPPFHTKRGNKKGVARSKAQIVVIFALGLTVLLLFTGLALDAGSIYVAYGHLKRAVDSGAVAASNAFRGNTNADGTPDYDKIAGAAAETIALDGLNVVHDATNKGLKTGDTQVNVFICSHNTDGSTDPSLNDSSSPNYNPEFFKMCPTVPPQTPRKLVWVEAKLNAQLYFLTLIGFSYVQLKTHTVSEAAPVDLVIVIDTSGSMGKDTSPTYGNKFSPARTDLNSHQNFVLNPHANPYAAGVGCNLDNTCEPLQDTKEAAIALLNTFYEGYDRVAVVSFDEYAQYQTGTDLNALEATNRFVSVSNAKTQIAGIKLHWDAPREKIWSTWRGERLPVDQPQNPPVLYNPSNPEDRDGDGLDADTTGAGSTVPPFSTHPLDCPDLTETDTHASGTSTLVDPQVQPLMAYQLRWWNYQTAKDNPLDPPQDQFDEYPDHSHTLPADWQTSGAPPVVGAGAANTHFGGAPCDSMGLFDSMNWDGVMPFVPDSNDLSQYLATPAPGFQALQNDADLRNWLVNPGAPNAPSTQNQKNLNYFLNLRLDTSHNSNELLPVSGFAHAGAREPSGTYYNGSDSLQREYHDVAGRLLSQSTTCTGCGIRTAFNIFNAGARNDATWVMVLLSDGAANVTDAPAQNPTFFTHSHLDGSGNRVVDWDISKSTTNTFNFPNGFCDGYINDGSLWSYFCTEQNAPTYNNTFSSGTNYLNSVYQNKRYCLFDKDRNPATGALILDAHGNQIDTCPPNYGSTVVVPLSKTDLDALPKRMLYGPVQYAMDMTDMLALHKSTNSHEQNLALFGDKTVGIYTIAFGEETISKNYSNGIPVGEELLRYMAAVGDDGDRTTNPCANKPTSTLAHPQSCGNYYFAPDSSALVGIFEDIGKRIQTRISY